MGRSVNMEVKNNNTYWIKRLSLNVPRPPLQSMSYEQASIWISTQAPGTRMYYQPELSCIK